MERLRRSPKRSVSKAELIDHARSERPELFDEAPCSSGCDTHQFKWQHEFDRCIYDLRSARPSKIHVETNRRGHYTLGR